MPADRTVDFVVMFLVIGMITMGLGSAALGWIMSRWRAYVPAPRTILPGHRSQAVEQHGNGGEPPAGTTFGTVVDYLEHCDDEALLDILAQLMDAEGDYRFAESRVAKFIPGRVEDRLAQVRVVRDTTPPPPGRQLRVRDDQGERVISMS